MPRNNTPTLDLPPELQQLMSLDQQGHPAHMQQEVPMPNPTMPNYADGGLVGPQGMPVQPGMPMDAPALGAQMQDGYHLSGQDVTNFVGQNPQAMEQIAQELQMMVQQGEITPQQLQMGGQLAMTALNEPETYPQLRQFAVQQGISSPEDVPEEYDEGFLFSIVLAAEAMGGQGEQPAPVDMKDGGYVTPGSNASQGGTVVGPGTGRSDSVPVNVSKGEYVVPAHVVEMKGREFFDKMLENYKPGGKDK